MTLSLIEFLLPLVFIVAISIPLVNVFRGKVTAKSAKRRLITHIGMFFGTISGFALFILIAGPTVLADTATSITGTLAQGLGFLAAALSTGISAMGAGIAVAAAAPAAIGAFSENEKNFAKSLIFVALGEGIALYGILISIFIINRL
jgi:V/A-type H+-transporting ATPase subunit K